MIEFFPRHPSGRFALCAGLLALWGCDPTDLSQLVQTTLTVSDSVVSAASPIEVSVVATNIGLIRVEVDPYGCPGTYHLRAWTDVLDRGLEYGGTVEVRLVDAFAADGR